MLARNSSMHLRRLRFEGVYNFRDLGGYECAGGMTKYGVFYRSTDLSQATKNDLARLSELGVKTVLDLRAKEEAAWNPDKRIKSCAYENISLVGDLTGRDFAVHGSVENTHTLWHMYRQLLLLNGGIFYKTLSFIADAETPLLFHCAQGKDRTGLVATLLYTIAGVDERDIVADYEVSRTYIKGTTSDISGSHFSNMESLLAFLHKTCGGADAYLTSIGVTDSLRQKIRKRFVADC